MVRKPPQQAETQEDKLENWVFNAYGSGIIRKYLLDIGENKDNSYACYPYTGTEEIEERGFKDY